MSWRISRAEFISSAVKKDQYPELGLPEIVFVGRSNVGKSSLINFLCERKNLARTSGTPGKTRTINFYKITLQNADKDVEQAFKQFCLVDLPGYGYAKVGRSERAGWQEFIQEYLLNAPNLSLVTQLIDSRHAAMDIDIDVHRWLGRQAISMLLAATKLDKLPKNSRQRQLALLEKAMPYSNFSIVGLSVLEKLGRVAMLDNFALVLEAKSDD